MSLLLARATSDRFRRKAITQSLSLYVTALDKQQERESRLPLPRRQQNP
jgi:hypothetical protein